MIKLREKLPYLSYFSVFNFIIMEVFPDKYLNLYSNI